MADAGEILFAPIGLGKFGKEFFGAMQIIFLILIMGSHILTFTIMLDTVSSHGACSILFALVGMTVSIICCLPRTLKKVSYLAIGAFMSIIAAMMVTMIGVAVERPNPRVEMTVKSDFYRAFLVSQFILHPHVDSNISMPPL